MDVLVSATGPALAVLAAMALAVVFVFVARWAGLRRAQIGYLDFLNGVFNVLKRGNAAEALALCDETTAPAARVTAAALRNLEGGAEVRRAAVDGAGRAEVGRLERRISVLAAIGQIAPLVGLFGLFCGFISAILKMGDGVLVVRANLLRGIVPGLFSAATGLAVAIFAHVAYALLRARLDRLAIDLEATADEVLTFLATLGAEVRG